MMPSDERDTAWRLSFWIAVGAFVGYWALIYRIGKGLLRDVRELGQWFRDWRAES